jgi:two-component system nitrogen regulation response regulator NtrX
MQVHTNLSTHLYKTLVLGDNLFPQSSGSFPQPDPAKPKQNPSPHGLMRHHLLVVDDDADVCGQLSKYLSRQGYQVTTASDFEAALSLAEELRPSLVILNVVMPDYDGLDLLEEIKLRHPGLPVIILTGLGFCEEVMQEALAKGAAGYVSKALPLTQLLMGVHRVLGRKPVFEARPLSQKEHSVTSH